MREARDILSQLAATGLTPEQFALVAELSASVAVEARPVIDQAAANKRAYDREYRRKNRTMSYETGETPSPDKASPQTPLQINPIPSPPLVPPSRRGTRLADDFEAPDDWIVWAMKKRNWSREEAADEAECFSRHWQAKPGKDAVKLDWPKTWQNWVSNSRRSNQPTAPPAYAWDGRA